MTLYYLNDPSVGRRLICPEEIDGCGAACDDDDGRQTDWTCPMCGKEWNVHDAEQALMELE